MPPSKTRTSTSRCVSQLSLLSSSLMEDAVDVKLWCTRDFPFPSRSEPGTSNAMTNID